MPCPKPYHFVKSRSKVCIVETPQNRKTMQRMAQSGQKRISYNMPQFCNEEKNKKGNPVTPKNFHWIIEKCFMYTIFRI
jgi:hypothetical protein